MLSFLSFNYPNVLSRERKKKKDVRGLHKNQPAGQERRLFHLVIIERYLKLGNDFEH